MESLFFNNPNQNYNVNYILNDKNGYIKKVDVTNSIIFLDSNLKDLKKRFYLKYFDPMIFIIASQKGFVRVKEHKIDAGEIAIFATKKQNFSIDFLKNSKSFTLFIANFYFKQFLLFKNDEPIDYIYNKINTSNELNLITKQPSDALSEFLIKKITLNEQIKMQSFKTLNLISDFLAHRLTLLDIYDKNLNRDDIKIAKKAKEYLLKNFVKPPTIIELAKICKTNDFKLKKAFKKVYKTTINNFIINLRLKEANILLKEKNYSIKEVANRVGYRHQGYFSKLFFKKYGIYPKDL